MDTMSTDNDDVCSVESFDSTADDVASSPSNERDEYQEVEKSTQDDTIRLQLWRVIVTIVLLSCTLAVTVTTYYVLEAENESNFSNAVRGWMDGWMDPFLLLSHPPMSNSDTDANTCYCPPCVSTFSVSRYCSDHDECLAESTQ